MLIIDVMSLFLVSISSFSFFVQPRSIVLATKAQPILGRSYKLVSRKAGCSFLRGDFRTLLYKIIIVHILNRIFL